MDPSKADEFNDLVFLNEFLEEIASRGDVTGMAPNNMEIRRQLIEKYGTKYFAWFGVDEAIWKEKIRYMILYYIWFIPALPFTSYILFSHDASATFYNLVIDLETGKPVFVDIQLLKRKPRYDLSQSLVYYSLFQIKKKGGKK